MIPKIIHYCWFGGSPIPQNLKDYINRWEQVCPDYQIMRWDETNFDYTKYQYSYQAFSRKEWAFVSDVARLHALYEYGGIYLDTDVEILKSFDFLLELEAFVGAEDRYDVNTGAAIGAKPRNEFVLENLKVYEKLSLVINGIPNRITCVEITTGLLRNYGYRNAKKISTINNVTIFPAEYFSPLKLSTGKLRKTSNTYSIHWYTTNWKRRSNLRKFIVRRTVPLKKFLRRVIDSAFGNGTYSRAKYKFYCMTKKGKKNDF